LKVLIRDWSKEIAKMVPLLLVFNLENFSNILMKFTIVAQEGIRVTTTGNWAEKAKPEHFLAEQCRNATVQNDVKRNKAE
jgi:hypothetical protein